MDRPVQREIPAPGDADRTAPRPHAVEVLLVEADPAARQFLASLLGSDPQIRVVGAVGDGKAALAFLEHSRPDVIVLTNQLPGMDGFETARRITDSDPIPIVLCAQAGSAHDTVFRSLEAGAVACIEKPDPGAALSQLRAAIRHLLQAVKQTAQARVVRRGGGCGRARPHAPPGGPARIVGIGASTGGPPVLQALLSDLPEGFPMPVLVVQHIARGFLSGMAEWLRQTSGLRVHIGAHGMQPVPGHVYLAPDDFQMRVDCHGRIVLSQDGMGDGLRPSIGCLFHSLADVCGSHAVGVLLTGMGEDGAAGLKRMRDRGAVTIAQDDATSVGHGMAGAAIALGGAAHVLPSDEIAGMLVALAGRRVPETVRG